MSDQDERLQRLFFEVFEPLPRQGPGNLASAERALKLCTDLPASSRVLDLGCGAGGQTLQLAELLPNACIVAVDSHAPAIERLRRSVSENALDARIEARVGDMANPEHAPESFDLIWSEGALYNLGIAEALRLYFPPLKPGGRFVFTEAVWRKPGAPEAVQAAFADYPGMGSVTDVLATIEASRFDLVGHFPLPDEAWWDDFYTPMEARLADLRER